MANSLIFQDALADYEFQQNYRRTIVDPIVQLYMENFRSAVRHCFQKYSHNKERREEWWEAMEWLCEDWEYPFGFIDTCHVLGYNALKIRAKILDINSGYYRVKKPLRACRHQGIEGRKRWGDDGEWELEMTGPIYEITVEDLVG